MREKVEAKVLAGAQAREIAEEIGTSNSVVTDWVKRARIVAPAVEFVELLPPGGLEDAPAAVEVLPPDSGEAPAGSAGKRSTAAAPTDPAPTAECRIRLGDAEIEIPAGYPGAHLAEVLRAVRASQ